MRNQGGNFIARCPLLSKNSRNILLSSFTPVLFTLLSSVSYLLSSVILPAFSSILIISEFLAAHEFLPTPLQGKTET